MELNIGTEFRRKGQAYRVVGFEHYENRHGWQSELIKLSSRCADCQRPFSLLATRTAINHSELRRRCDLHKQPGVPVRKPATRKRHLARSLPTGFQPTAAVSPAVAATAPEPGWIEQRGRDGERFGRPLCNGALILKQVEPYTGTQARSYGRQKCRGAPWGSLGPWEPDKHSVRRSYRSDKRRSPPTDTQRRSVRLVIGYWCRNQS